MRVYRNDAYESRGFSWQPPGDAAQQYRSDPYSWQRQDPSYDSAEDRNSYDPYPPFLPYSYPRYPEPYPPYPYPVPYSGNEPRPEPRRRRRVVFGYFASTTTGGSFTGGGLIPFTFADSLNRNVSIIVPNSTQVKMQVPGIYRVVYSVTTTAAVTGVFLQILRNSTLVASSPIPILEGVNENEIFLNLIRNDVLSLNLTNTVVLANGKNASLLLQLIAPTAESDSDSDSDSDFENQ
jgi:hypothetical protein